VLKLLQIQPAEEVVREYIMQSDSKYLRVLGAFYMRLTRKADSVYKYIEPLYSDFRKVRILNADGSYALSHIDEVAEQMIYRDHMFDIALPRIPKRIELEVRVAVQTQPDSHVFDIALPRIEFEASRSTSC
jgi:pre-mRNA-splicing factor 38A